MFWLIKQGFISLLSFSESLATKCVSLNKEPYMVRPIFIDLNPLELNYYQFIISVDICGGRCSSFDDLSLKICVPSKTEDLNVQVLI